jgi:hypothetical protein
VLSDGLDAEDFQASEEERLQCYRITVARVLRDTAYKLRRLAPEQARALWQIARACQSKHMEKECTYLKICQLSIASIAIMGMVGSGLGYHIDSSYLVALCVNVASRPLPT